MVDELDKKLFFIGRKTINKKQETRNFDKLFFLKHLVPI
jgi:hypothetical protein